MKVRDFIETTAANYCVDVYDNYTEELGIAYCGEKLTDAGKRHFRKALSLNIEAIHKDTVIIEVDKKDLTEEQSEANLAAAKDLFESMAGMCAADDYEKWFIGD